MADERLALERQIGGGEPPHGGRRALHEQPHVTASVGEPRDRLGPVADTQWRGRSTTEVWEEDFGIRPRQRNLLVRPVRLAGEVLEVLALAPGAPGVYIRRIKVDEMGNVIEIDHEYWRFDAVEFRM